MSRSSLYYQPVGLTEEELTLLRLIDEQYLKTPFYSSRRMTAHLRQQGLKPSLTMHTLVQLNPVR